MEYTLSDELMNTQEEQRAASKEYVLGFCFAPKKLRSTDPDPIRNFDVVLIRKNKPAWQNGLLNGVGGKIETGESPDEAMEREWREETGTTMTDWEPLVVMRFQGAVIFVFKKMVHAFPEVKSMTPEPVYIWDVSSVMRNSGKIPNLNWLIPMALFDAPKDTAKAPNIFYL